MTKLAEEIQSVSPDTNAVSVQGVMMEFRRRGGAPFREHFDHFHPFQTDTDPAGWFLRLLPVWALFTYLFVQNLLKRVLSAEREQLQAVNEFLTQRLDQTPPPDAERPGPPEPFVVSSGGEEIALDLHTISHITVEEHYCSVFVRGRDSLRRIEIKLALKEALQQLPEAMFLQIHRSHVVNLSQVTRVRRTGRSYELDLGDSGVILPISRHRLSEVLPRLKNRSS